MPESTPVRVQAALTVAAVLRGEGSLSSLLLPAQELVKPEDKSLLQQLCYGTLRWQPRLQAILNRVMDKPLRERDADIRALLLLGLFQLEYLRTPDHAAIATAVDACHSLKKAWAGKLVNAVLRRFQREHESLRASLASSPAFVSAHPNWLRKSVEGFWPCQATQIFTANNDHPPFTLRLNLAIQSRHDYLQRLRNSGLEATPSNWSRFGVTLANAVDVTNLPGFSQGEVSVQDEAAQLAAELLQLQSGQRVLDACCAPGGKTGHILELAQQLDQPLSELVALDLESRRLRRVEENLQRLRHSLQPWPAVRLQCADALQPEQWWDGNAFDRILLDAPCSATGVIRRHPDIKVLRKATDIAKLGKLQLDLLRCLWRTLQPGGRLIYATCSILPTENRMVVEHFLASEKSARHLPIEAQWGLEQSFGRQLLPRIGGNDGFYYACLTKRAQ